MASRSEILAALIEHNRATAVALQQLAALPDAPAVADGLPPLGDLFAIVRKHFGPIGVQRFVDEVDAWYKGEELPADKRPLGPADFQKAAVRLGGTVPQVRAVDEVESAGGGFVDNVRAEIFALDGPGGFIDDELSKILFEAHKFHRHTGGRYDKSHPALSSPKWNRSLYKGGQEEWRRLHAAMQLDASAALKSASWGRYQILGENHRLCGFPTVEAFVDAMQSGEPAHLDAFVSFVINSGLTDEFRRISDVEGDCAPFAAGYNGPGYNAQNYDLKISQAHKKWRTR